MVVQGPITIGTLTPLASKPANLHYKTLVGVGADAAAVPKT